MTEALRSKKSEHDVLRMDVGPKIRAARLERGMSLAQVGGEDLSRSFLSLVERGRSRISLRALAIVADRLELPIAYFLPSDGSDIAAELGLDRAQEALGRERPDECLRLLDQLTLSPAHRLRGLVLRGRALTRAGRPREAIPVLQEARQLAETASDVYESARVPYYLGSALYAAATFDEAFTYFRDALELLRPDEDPILLGKVTVYLGHILYIRDDIDAALQHYARARDLFDRFGDLDSLAAVYSGLSLAFERKGDRGNALRYSKLSLGAYEARQDVRQSARELNNLAMKYLDLGNLEQARTCAEDAVQRAVSIHASDLEAASRGTLARIYLELDQPEKAAAEAERVQPLEGAETSLAQVAAWAVLADVAERQGDSARADELYQRALDDLERRGQHVTYAEKALAYTELLRRRGEIERALEYAVRAARAQRPAQ